MLQDNIYMFLHKDNLVLRFDHVDNEAQLD